MKNNLYKITINFTYYLIAPNKTIAKEEAEKAFDLAMVDAQDEITFCAVKAVNSLEKIPLNKRLSTPFGQKTIHYNDQELNIIQFLSKNK